MGSSQEINPSCLDARQAVADLVLPASDLFLFGDGSGTTADKPAAWCVYAYEPSASSLLQLSGRLSHGTNNLVELFPYVHALWRVHIARFGNRERSDFEPFMNVCVVSDSEVTVRAGEGRYSRAANGCFWAAIDWFSKNKYAITWRHVPRNSTVLHAACDRIAGKIRISA